MLHDALGKQPLLIKASVLQVTLGFKHLKITLILLFMTPIYLFSGESRAWLGVALGLYFLPLLLFVCHYKLG